MTSINSPSPIKAIHIQVPVGIPTADGGLEIPNRVFLGGIPTETTELELELFFTEYGVVKDVRIVTDRVTGECKGYGFVTFDDNEDINNLIKKKTITMKGKKLRIRKAIRRNGSQFNSSPSSSETSPSGSDQQLLYVPQPSTAQPQQYSYPHPVFYSPSVPAIPPLPSPQLMSYPCSPPQPVYYLPYNQQACPMFHQVGLQTF